MALQAGAQLILQTERTDGRYDCVGFEGLHTTYPAVIVLSCADTRESVENLDALRAALLARLQLLHPRLAPVKLPCAGCIEDASSCHAQSETDCMKLLVLVGDGSQPIAVQASHQPWIPGTPLHHCLPVFPISARSGVSRLLPQEFKLPNANFWSRSVDEVLPAILARSGLTVENPRIFISYRQTDSAALAMQLFDALNRAGFDTFLDHFRIDPGVNFQTRLTQHLGDKSMVLLLESEHILESEWTMYEVNTAKACSLGLFALHLPAGKATPGVDDGVRQVLTSADFTRGSFVVTAELKPEVLANVVQRVRSEHDMSLVRRRRILYDSLDSALDAAGVHLESMHTNGVARVYAKNGTEYVIWLTPRPPELLDFHGIYDHALTPVRGVVIGLSRLMEPARRLQTNWLADLAKLRMVDEGMIRVTAAAIAEGRL